MAPPPPTSDPLLLREHAFYDTGNMKYVSPFIKFQTYNLNPIAATPAPSSSSTTTISLTTDAIDDHVQCIVIKLIVIAMLLLAVNSKVVHGLFKRIGRHSKHSHESDNKSIHNDISPV